ncbi:ubiquitin carboxyl-terminal hydrolase 22/27/51 [Nematocida homosporus]|uniref:ubiquitin carboxyl-terminal hydrolase 22/27/51 n=1 Tax=Nematocida homosporus TaxID=1912981 RepID=UPI002220E212|nr:ubiquitin carboxyl-terminal hydrolase 22/27/51 [Nematocida homosporus]KAI5187436.1 ubiquitin carboxyl-terminal hydrolase 22/27/51 [Nematocida homosporus]
MSCTHLDTETTAERCASLIGAFEIAISNGQNLVCCECSDQMSLEVCLECAKIFCRVGGHVHSHARQTWHRLFLVVRGGQIGCEECAGYFAIPDVIRAQSGSGSAPGRAFKPLNLQWVKGFLNLKRTCYMSSLLQALLGNVLFLQNFLAVEAGVAKCRDRDCLSCALNRIIYQMYSSEDGYVDISGLVRIFWRGAPGLASSEHQDAQECFTYLGQQIHAASRGGRPCQCAAHRTFGGSLGTSVVCAECGREEAAVEPFMSLGIDVQESGLEAALEAYLREEEVRVDKTCACGNKQRFLKKQFLREMPQVFCFHLKRYQMRNNGVFKIDKVLEYPDTFKIIGQAYELSSVILHSGEADSGHYIAYTKRGTQWYLTNDEEISRATRSDVFNQSTAYILFYSSLSPPST